MSDTDLILKDSSIYKKIKCIEMHPKEEMYEEDWRKLADTIEEVIPNFIPMLKNQVSYRDYRICLLIRLGISASLMARLLNLSDAAISKSRKTMLKKYVIRKVNLRNLMNMFYISNNFRHGKI